MRIDATKTGPDSARVLLISAHGGKGMVFPKVGDGQVLHHKHAVPKRAAGARCFAPVVKFNCMLQGGWETDETVEAAAKRETIEEAGVRGTLEVRTCKHV